MMILQSSKKKKILIIIIITKNMKNTFERVQIVAMTAPLVFSIDT